MAAAETRPLAPLWLPPHAGGGGVRVTVVGSEQRQRGLCAMAAVETLPPSASPRMRGDGGAEVGVRGDGRVRRCWQDGHHEPQRLRQ